MINKRESLTRSIKPIALSIALLTMASAAPTFAAEPAETLAEAFSGGKPFANLRLRYESAEIDNGNIPDADALTLRTTFGYETGSYKGFSVLVEAEDSREVLGVRDFSVNPAGVRVDQFDTIADPETTELEQAYVQYQAGGFTGKFGRQTFTLDNHRFVGHVGWRQDRQTFDAVKLNYQKAGFDLTGAYITQRNRIFAEVADVDAEDIILNASYKAGFGKLVLYSYLLEEEDLVNSTSADAEIDTYGISYTGSTKAGETTIGYRAEYATQDNDTTNTDTDYFNLGASADFGLIKLSLGYESLGSDDGVDAFATPLATLHGFNGWADVFLATPTVGLEDFSATLDAKFGGGKFTLAYHDFSADDAAAGDSDDLGSEIDVRYTRDFGKHVYTGIKYADYSDGSSSASPADTERFWIWAGLKFK